MLGALLGNIAFAIGGGAARRTVVRNPVSPTLPAQLSVARGQTVAGIRGGLTGLSGSEQDYADGQRTPDILVQDLTAHAMPPARFFSNLRRAPAIEAYYRGPVDLRRARWGGSTRGVPRLVSSTLLQPTSRTPRPEVLQAARNQAHPELARLTDVFDEE